VIDVSTLCGPCPRCPGRRVWRVSVPTDEWSCIDNARPFPSAREHVRDHDATIPADNLEDANELMRLSALKFKAAFKPRTQVTNE